MRFIAKLAGLSLALVALAGFTASSAFANGSATGVLTGETFAGNVGPCGFAMDYTGTPDGANDGVDLTFQGASFVGVPVGSDPACDTAEIQAISNIATSVSGSGSSFTASLAQFSIDVSTDLGDCTYTTTGVINAMGTALFGPYTGNGQANGAGFPCNIAPADITVEDVLLVED